jgi:thioredoxin 1
MTTEELTKLYQENDKILLKFGASWCGPCKAMEPVLKEVAAERPDVRVIELDVDENEELVQLFRIRNVPIMFLIKCGVTINKFVGGASKSQILSFIDEQPGK